MSKFAPHRASASNPRATPDTICQKCLGRGHFTYQCKKSRPYVSRPSRTALMDNPKLREKEKEKRRALLTGGVPEEFRNKEGVADALLEAKEKARKAEQSREDGPVKKKPKRSKDADSSSSDSDSESDSDSGSESASDSNSDDSRSESSDSEDSRDRRRRRPRRAPSSPPSRRSRSSSRGR